MTSGTKPREVRLTEETLNNFIRLKYSDTENLSMITELTQSLSSVLLAFYEFES